MNSCVAGQFTSGRILDSSASGFQRVWITRSTIMRIPTQSLSIRAVIFMMILVDSKKKIVPAFLYAIALTMSFTLVLSHVSPATWSHELTERPQILGRDDTADIRLEHRSVSRKHCQFWIEKDECHIADCGSTNGTFLNGEQIKNAVIRSGDRVLVGRFEIMLASKEQVDPTDYGSVERSSAPVFQSIQDEERYFTAAIHERLTPSRRLVLPGMKLEVAYRSSGLLGGDCFECFEMNDRWVLALFDAMNHGTRAALTVMLLKSELRRWIELSSGPAKCLECINRELLGYHVSELYITAIIVVWSPHQQSLLYSTAGHYPPLIVRGSEPINLMNEANGFPLGVEWREKYEEKFIQMKTGDRFYLTSDGVGEALRGRNDNSSTPSVIEKSVHAQDGKNLLKTLQSIQDNYNENLQDDALLVGGEILSDTRVGV